MIGDWSKNDSNMGSFKHFNLFITPKKQVPEANKKGCCVSQWPC